MTDDETVARSILEHFDHILERWTVGVQGRVSARGLSKPETTNLMPLYLRSLAQPELGPLGEPDGRRNELVEAHLTSRLRQGFDLAEIVDEFALLGRCMSELWAEDPEPRRPHPVAVERLFTELHMAAARVTELFQEHMLEEEQMQKRFIRRLERAASHALHSPSDAERDLAEALDVIDDATGATAVAVVVEDVRTGTRHVSGPTGGPRAAIALRAFAAGLGLNDEVDDAIVTAEIATEHALRMVGIGRLLVTRLPAGGAHRCALLVALHENRSFTSREIGRIEVFADRLAIHLDRVRLFGELRDAIEQLRAERTMRERFVTLLAHDLRTPLGTATIQVEMLSASDVREVREAGIRLSRVLDRIDRMVTDLLDAARIHAGELPPLDVTEGNLREVVREAVEDVVAQHPGRVVLEPGDDVHGWFGAAELRRATTNLLVNAIKYGRPDALVRASVGTADGWVTIAVHNEGDPIPEAIREGLFAPFSRRSATERGWGLGLTLVRGAAAAHGGAVDVESDVAHGTTFTIRIPVDARRRAAAAE